MADCRPAAPRNLSLDRKARYATGDDNNRLDQEKILDDWIIATQETIYILQTWLGLLEQWRAAGRIEPDDFSDACHVLRDANLWSWAAEAGGHGLAALSELVIKERNRV